MTDQISKVQKDILLPKNTVCFGLRKWLTKGEFSQKRYQLCHGVTMIPVRVSYTIKEVSWLHRASLLLFWDV
jgi:hypothetical protein